MADVFHTGSDCRDAASGPGFSWLATIVHRVRAGARSALRASQTGRMVSVLSGMSDEQLGQIGITRSQIGDYARELMANE